MTVAWLILAVALASSLTGAATALTCRQVAATMRGECPECGRPRKTTTR